MTTWTSSDLGWTNRGSHWTLLVGSDGDALVCRRADLPVLLELLDRSGARYDRPRSGRGGRLAIVTVGRFKPAGYRLPTGATVELRVLAAPAMARAA